MPYIIALFVIFIIVVISNIKVVPQAFAYVIERFGGYHTTWGVGIHVKVPFIDRISKKVNLSSIDICTLCFNTEYIFSIFFI